MAISIDGKLTVEVCYDYGVKFSDGEIEELDSQEEAEETADFLPGAEVVTRTVYVTDWSDCEPPAS